MNNPTSAKAERITVEEKVITTKQLPRVLLTLTEAQAQFLTDILSKVGGDPMSTRRALQEDITSALRTAGFDFQNRTLRDRYDTPNPLYDLSGGITVHQPGKVPPTAR